MIKINEETFVKFLFFIFMPLIALATIFIIACSLIHVTALTAFKNIIYFLNTGTFGLILTIGMIICLYLWWEKQLLTWKQCLYIFWSMVALCLIIFVLAILI